MTVNTKKPTFPTHRSLPREAPACSVTNLRIGDNGGGGGKKDGGDKVGGGVVVVNNDGSELWL